MKRITLHHALQRKIFTEKSNEILPRLLNPLDEISLRELENRSHSHTTPENLIHGIKSYGERQLENLDYTLLFFSKKINKGLALNDNLSAYFSVTFTIMTDNLS